MKAIGIAQFMLCAGIAALCGGQTQTPGNYNGSSPLPTTGKFVAHVSPRDEIGNLEVLVRASPLIVDGTVTSSLPPVGRVSGKPMVMETHSYVTVNRVLKGNLSAGTKAILLAEEGGTTPQVETEVEGNPLVVAGGHYLLFLERDERTVPTNSTGAPRFVVTGVVAGKVKVEGGAVQFMPGATKLLHENDGTPVASFVGKVEDLVNFRVKGPVHAIPFPGPPSKTP